MKKIEAKSIIKGFLVLVFFTYSYLFQYIPIYLFHIQVNDLRGNYILSVLFSTFSSILIFIVLLFVYRKDLKDDLKIFLKDPLVHLNDGIVYWIIGLAVMCCSNIFLATFFHSNGANNENVVQAMIAAYPIIMGIDVCFLAPFNEELVYRKTFYDIIPNRKIFVILSFFVFGYVHVSSMATNYVDWLYMIPYGALGCAFAAAYSKTDTVYTSMFLHMIHNVAIFLMSVISFI